MQLNPISTFKSTEWWDSQQSLQFNQSYKRRNYANNPHLARSGSLSSSSFSNTNQNYLQNSGSKSFKCMVCPLVFFHLSELKSHVNQSHSEDTDAYPFVCEVCNKGFFTRWTLRQHGEKHSAGINCHICSKFFKFTRSLRMHLEVDHCLRKCRRCKQFYKYGIEFDKHIDQCLSDQVPMLSINM